jgi:hypothetical protein
MVSPHSSARSDANHPGPVAAELALQADTEGVGDSIGRTLHLRDAHLCCGGVCQRRWLPAHVVSRVAMLAKLRPVEHPHSLSARSGMVSVLVGVRQFHAAMTSLTSPLSTERFGNVQHPRCTILQTPSILVASIGPSGIFPQNGHGFRSSIIPRLPHQPPD